MIDGQDVRPAACAGTWYPSRASVLADEVDRYLAEVPPAVGVPPLALVAPHAGLKYSGRVAAHAYAALRTRALDAVVLIGPSHYVAFDGVSVYPQGAFDSPLGAVPVEQDLARALLDASAAHVYPAAHVREHSLEMQLPFLARLLPGVPIVPLVMGDQVRTTAFGLGRAVAAALAGRRAVIVASSDLSHFHDAPTARRLDDRVLRHIPVMDAEGLMSLLEARPDHACGGGPIVAAMVGASLLGARKGRVLDYADSGDVSGDKTSVVGYVAAAFSPA